MAGRILNASLRDDIAGCFITAIEEATTRRGLIAVWRAAKLTLGGEDKRLEVITAACQDRNSELGFTPQLKTLKGGKSDA